MLPLTCSELFLEQVVNLVRKKGSGFQFMINRDTPLGGGEAF